MNLPSLNRISSERTVLSAFGGYNHNLSISEGENYEELNLTAENYPVLSVREPYGKYWCKDITTEYKFPSKVFSFCSSGVTVFESGIKINDTLFLGRAITSAGTDAFGLMLQYSSGYFPSSLTESDFAPGEKIIRMGNKFIFPRIKKYLDFFEGRQLKDIEHTNTIQCSDNNKVRFAMCTLNGGEISQSDIVVSTTAPADTTKYWVDTSSTPHTLKKYSSAQSEWVTVVTTYIRISSPSIHSGFSVGDGIKISGISENCQQLYDLLNDKVSVIREIKKRLGTFTPTTTVISSGKRIFLSDNITKTQADEFNSRPASEKAVVITYTDGNGQSHTETKKVNKLWYNGELSPQGEELQARLVLTTAMTGTITSIEDVVQDCIVVQGILDTYYEQNDNELIFSREMPKYDVIFECNNRLWVGYKNEIFASKLGDPTNWYVYDGIASDSYALSTGTSENFTGGCNYNGYPLFFREKEIIKIYGDYPSNYQTQNLICDGVKSGCGESIVNIGGYLYYYSPSGVTVYSGSYPTNINTQFGSLTFKDVMGAALKNILYYVVKDNDNNQFIFSYDTIKGIWHKCTALEDTKQIYSTAKEIYFVAKDGETYNGYKLISDEEPDSSTLTEAEKAKFLNEKVKWGAQSGQLDGSMVDRKYVQKLLVKYSMSHSSKMRIYISYDNGAFECVFNAPITDLDTYSVPLMLRRCDHYRLKFEGEGPCDIYSITKTIVQRSDRR